MDGDKTGGACHPHEEQWCSHTYATAIRRKNKVFVVDMIKKKSKSYSKPLGCHGKKTPFFFLFSKNPALFISKCWERRGDNKRRLIEWWPLYIYIYVCVSRTISSFLCWAFAKAKGIFMSPRREPFPPFIVRVLLCPPTLLIWQKKGKKKK